MSPRYVIQIISRADGEPSYCDGLYVKRYSPNGRGGQGDLLLTLYEREAEAYDSTGAAMQAWRAQSETHPIRLDGKPNRPLTAFTVDIHPLKA